MADTAPVAPAPATPAKKGRKPKEGGKAKAAKSDRPPTLQLITKAIAADKDPKGSSVRAIKKYILANYKVRSSTMLNHMLKRALTAGVASGTLSRPQAQTGNGTLVGRYRLGKEDKKKAAAKPKTAAKSPAKKPAAKKPKAKAAKKPAAKKAKSPKKVKKSPKKPAVKKTVAKKSPKKAAKK